MTTRPRSPKGEHLAPPNITAPVVVYEPGKRPPRGGSSGQEHAAGLEPPHFVTWPQPPAGPDGPHATGTDGVRRPWTGYVHAETGRPFSLDWSDGDGTYITAAEWKRRHP